MKVLRMPTILALVAAVALAVAGQILVKYGINELRDDVFAAGLIRGYARILSSTWVIAGSLLYVVSVFFWLFSLAKVEISFAYPFVSLSYVLIILASRFLLGETISPLRWIGVASICAGVVLVSRT